MKCIYAAFGAVSVFSAAFGCAPAGRDPMQRPAPIVSASPPAPDPRAGLRAGWMDAGEAVWNLEVVSKTPPTGKFIDLTQPGADRLINSDLAFTRNYAILGNFWGFQIFDVSNPREPRLRTSFVCPGSQGDVTVYRNLLFVSSEAINARTDCGVQGIRDTVSTLRARGIRIFDISDITRPKYLTTVQTCRGSHTNTLVQDPRDSSVVYIYISGASRIRSPNELAGCSALLPGQDPRTALFRIEVIRVPLAQPQLASIVSSPRIFENLPAVARHGESAADSALMLTQRRESRARQKQDSIAGRMSLSAFLEEDTAVTRTRGPTQCHDITTYPAVGLAGGACRGYGLLLDIRNVANPRRIDAVADPNFAFWHSATFNNDGTKVIFTDEWGGGTQPRCRAGDRPEWGANAIFTLANNKLTFRSYYKLPALQSRFENCVAHNGSLIPVPGRDIMVQAWYQGGISIFDFTDPERPREIAYFDRGPMDSTKMVQAGYWSAYWYNGYIYGSEMARGLDVFRLVPSPLLSANEIAAAESVRLEFFNAQDQPRFVWPASFAVVRSYLDQLMRGDGISRARSSAIARALDSAERLQGAQRSAALRRLAGEVAADLTGATDAARVRAMHNSIVELAR